LISSGKRVAVGFAHASNLCRRVGGCFEKHRQGESECFTCARGSFLHAHAAEQRRANTQAQQWQSSAAQAVNSAWDAPVPVRAMPTRSRPRASGGQHSAWTGEGDEKFAHVADSRRSTAAVPPPEAPATFARAFLACFHVSAGGLSDPVTLILCAARKSPPTISARDESSQRNISRGQRHRPHTQAAPALFEQIPTTCTV